MSELSKCESQQGLQDNNTFNRQIEFIHFISFWRPCDSYAFAALTFVGPHAW